MTAPMVTQNGGGDSQAVTMPNGWRVVKGDCGYFATHPWLIPEDKRRYGLMTRVCKDPETLIDEVAANNMFWETIEKLSRTINEQRQAIDELRATPTTAANKPAVTTSGHTIQLPARLTDAGWELIEDTPGTWIATHPRYGATPPTIFSGHRPDLAQKYMVEKISLLMPPDEGLTLTSISHRLTSINDGVAQLESQATQLENEIERLNRNRCTGRPWYRTAGSGTVFLYANHTAGTTCPLCGRHPEGGRLRRFIGEETAPPAQDVLEAMANQRLWVEATSQRDEVKRQLQHIDRLIWQLEAATK
jgi:hypothetical protein